MSKLIFLDVDGTLTLPGRPINLATAAAIRAARANGHKVFLSTGRLEANVAEDVLSIGFDGGIYSAGGRIVVDGKEILNRSMPYQLVEHVTDTMREFNLYFMLENASGTYEGSEEQPPSYVSADLRCFLKREMHVLPHKLMPEEDIVYKIVFLAETRALAEKLVQKLSAKAKVVYFSGLLTDMNVVPGEISDWNINKGDALVRICRYLNADPGDSIAFGDSMNDLEILQVAGAGIAMGNADDHVKALADQICGRCDEDGVAKALAGLKLI